MRSFLTGLATGLAVGYLTAPRSGKDTRNQLADAAAEQPNGLRDQWSKIAGEVSNLVNTIKSQSGLFASTVNAYAGQPEDTFKKIKRDVGSMTNQATNQYNDKVADTADATKAGVNKAQDALTL